MPDDRFKQRYFEIAEVLDRAHGTEETDGAGAGIVAEVELLLTQRDEARTEARLIEQERDNALLEVERLRAELTDARFGTEEES